MALWTNRSAGTAARNGTTTHDLPFTAAAAGSLLVAIVGGAVTTAWPGGWTEQLQPVNAAELSVATKTATAGESTVTVTHNASDYPVQWVIYEFPAGSTWGQSATLTGTATGSTTMPTATGLPGVTGTEVLFAIVGAIGGATLPSTVWSGGPTGLTEDVDAGTAFASTDGAYLSVAYADDVTTTTATALATVSTPVNLSVVERATFSINVFTGTQPLRPTMVSDRGSVANATAATTSPVALTSPTAISVGNYLIARVAVDNSGTNGAAPGCTVTDPRSNVWTVLGPANVDPGAAAAGATAYLCYTKVTTAYQAADSITFNWGGVSTTAKAIVVEEWTKIHATTPVAVSAVTATGTATGTVAIAITPTAADQMVYTCLASEGIAADTFTGDADTTNGSWATLTTIASANATATNNQRVMGQYKQVTASGAQTWNATITARDWAGIAVVFAPSVSSIPAGTGAGSYAYVGAAAGKKTPKATGAGTYAYVGAAAGKRTPAATGSGTYTYAGAGSGSQPTVVRSGSGAGTYAYAGAATGKRTPKAVASGAYAYAGSATGKRVAGATASGTYAYTGAATGKRVAGATGSGTYAYASAATGKRVPKATTEGSYTYTGAGTGKRSPAATATGTYAYAGAAAGKRTPAATGSGAYAYAGAASGKRVAKASTAGNYDYASAGVGKRTPKGAGATGGAFGQDPFGSLPFGSGPNVYHYKGSALTTPAPGQGAGSGTYAYAGAATGKRIPKATGPGTYSYAGAASGKRTPKGQTSGAYAYVGLAVGVRPTVLSNTGNGVGVWAYTGAATGKRVPKATGSGSWTYVGGAAGKTAHKGVGSGAWVYSGAAVGKRVPKASGDDTWQYAGAASASTARSGSGSGSWVYDGFAFGSEFPFVAFGEEFFAFI